MMMLNTSSGSFGPFRSAVLQGDAWLCDGVLYPVIVIGSAEVVQGMPDPAPVPLVVPKQCSMYAARTILYKEGLLKLVEDVIAAMTGEDGDLARIKWASALTVRRDDDLVTQVIPQLGKSEAEIDAMFVAGDLVDRAP